MENLILKIESYVPPGPTVWIGEIYNDYIQKIQPKTFKLSVFICVSKQNEHNFIKVSKLFQNLEVDMNEPKKQQNIS